MEGIVIEATKGMASEASEEVIGEVSMHKVNVVLVVMSPEVGCLVGILPMATMGSSN